MIMKPPLKSKIITSLKKLINSKKKKELTCAKYLEHIPEILFRKGDLLNLINKKSEIQQYSGRADYIISGQVRDTDNTICRRAYVWELKAPQCYIFKKDTKTRLKPTQDLVEAENQLINYFHESKGNSIIADTFNVTPDNIVLGGIIIGCSKTLVDGNYDESDKATLYQRAKILRETYFYQQNIALMTWDNVLNKINFKLNTEKISNKNMSFNKVIMRLNIKSSNILIAED